VLTVRDTETGIPAEQVPRLFERFHRVRGARGRSYEGSGIGLALVQELVKQHGGSVRIESQVDRGRSRTLAPTEVRGEAYVQEGLRWLPGRQTVSDDVQVAPPASLEQPRPQSIANSAQRSRILLADDNVDMREYVQRLLLEQYEVVAVANGESALEAARQIRPT